MLYFIKDKVQETDLYDDKASAMQCLNISSGLDCGEECLISSRVCEQNRGMSWNRPHMYGTLPASQIFLIASQPKMISIYFVILIDFQSY